MTQDADISNIPPSHLDILGKNALAYVATLGPDGAPQNTPVWFEWDGTHVRFSLTTGRQKYRNIKRDPRVTLSITDTESPYRNVEVRGVVDKIDEDPDKKFISELSVRYVGKAFPEKPEEHRVVINVMPKRVTTYG